MIKLSRVLIVLGAVATHTLEAQRLESLRVIHVPTVRGDTNLIADVSAPSLSGACHVSRGVALGLAGYLGYLVGELAQFPLALSGESGESIGINVVGAVAGVILIADAPLSRPLPFCPKEMLTLANRPTPHVAACRASRVLNGGLGAAAGAVAAGALAIPFVLANSGRSIVNGLLITLPAAGAIGGAVRAGHAPPCTSSFSVPTSGQPPPTALTTRGPQKSRMAWQSLIPELEFGKAVL